MEFPTLRLPRSPIDSRWLKIPAPRFGDGDAGGAGGAVDLSTPAAQAAIAAAADKAAKAMVAGLEEEKGKLTANNKALLEEKKPWEELAKTLGAKKPEEVAAIVAKAREIETKAKAGEHGVDPAKYEADVDRAAQAKYASREEELSGVMGQQKEEIAKLTTTISELTKTEHLTWAAYQLAVAGLDGVHEGARSHLISTLASSMVKQAVDGHPIPIPRFKVNGVLIPGGGPDGLATPQEVLALARQGKGPFGALSYCFVSAGQGSDTKSAETTQASGAGLNWWKMDEKARSEYTRKNGSRAAQELIDNSGPKPAAALAA